MPYKSNLIYLLVLGTDSFITKLLFSSTKDQVSWKKRNFIQLNIHSGEKLLIQMKIIKSNGVWSLRSVSSNVLIKPAFW